MTTLPLINDDLEMGGKDDIECDFSYNNNVHDASVKIRLAFLKKVYTLLSVQLLITTAFGFTLMNLPAARNFVSNHDELIIFAFIISFVTLLALHIKRKDYPTNFILLSIFTVVQAYTVGVIVTYYDKMLVLQALVLTLVVLGGLTAFTFQTKRDFSSLGLVLFSCLIVLIVGGFMQLLFPSSFLELCISIFGAIIFSLFIIYDTQNIMQRVSPEEYILATIELYLDIINLFLYILRALEAIRRS